MKCGPNLSKYFKKNEIPVADYVESVAPESVSDEDEVPGAQEAEDDDPIRGKRPGKRKAGE